MIVSIRVGEEVQDITINRMTDISTVMFAIMKEFCSQNRVDELLDENKELTDKNRDLTDRVEELEELNDAVETALKSYGYDEIDELTGAYDDACKLLGEIHDMTYDYH